MVHQIKSQATGLILHEIYRRQELSGQVSERVDLGDVANFLQVAALRVQSPKSFRSHTHLERHRTFENLRAQESWVIIKGNVIVHYFDENDQKICDETLQEGDVTITYFGGHGYTLLGSETLIYEFKSGPYEGQIIDKRFISE